MRSIKYAVTGKNPSNFDDCVDYYLKNKVSVKLEIHLSIKAGAFEETLVDYLTTNYIWTFSDGTVVNDEKQYGGILFSEDGNRKAKSLENAHLRLSNDVEWLKRSGIQPKLNKTNFMDVFYGCIS